MKISLMDNHTGECLFVDVDFPNRQVADTSPTPSHPLGLVSQLGASTAGLFSFDHRLFALIDGRAYEMSEPYSVYFSQNATTCKLTFPDTGSELILEYPRPHPVSTLFYSETEEDADFGLWIFNIVNSDERKLGFVNNWEKGFQ